MNRDMIEITNSSTSNDIHNAWISALPEGWKYFTLLELASEIIDNRGRSAPLSEKGIVLIATNCINNDGLYPTREKIRYVSEETYKTWFRGHPKPGDVIIVNKGTPGLVCQVPDPVDFCIAQDMVALRPNKRIVDGEYLLAALRSPLFSEQVRAFTVGTTIPHLKKGDFSRLLVPVPPMHEQYFIGNLYCNLSRKIELNRKMNETLESIARALFKSWFVDFDPVRAKMEGRVPYGMDAETAALFPDGFEDSALGKVPRGWKVGRLDDLLILQRGYDLPTNQRTSGPFPVISAGGFSGSHIEYKAQGPGVATGRSGLLGKVFFVHENFWPLNTTLYIKEYKVSSPTHAYYILSNIDFEGFNAGSAVPTLNRNHVHNLPAIVPSSSVIKAFDNLVMPLFNYCYQNKQQSLTLSTLRDTLLPKLLSGEVRVGDVEREVGVVL